jgi:hypothetical protein
LLDARACEREDQGMHTPRSVTALLAFLSAVAAVAAAAAAGPAGAAQATTPRCATSGLVVWLDTRGDGAAGSVFYRLKFTNLSRRTCTLTGYPGVSAVDLRGRRLGTPAGRDPARPVRTVRLAPRATASTVLQIVSADNFPRARCRQTTAAGLRVFPPNQTKAKIVPFPFRACARSGPVFLQVRTVR